MSELINKLSSYNIFNYLLPGVVFAIFGNAMGYGYFVRQDIFTGAFLYYFLGLVISRVGSIVLEPILKRLSIVKFGDYKQFVIVSKQDPKLEILSETNNTYRTLAATFLILLVLHAWDKLRAQWTTLGGINRLLITALLFVLFIYSYRKQTEYISKRILANGIDAGAPNAKSAETSIDSSTKSE